PLWRLPVLPLFPYTTLFRSVAGYPADPARDCSWGCWAFESMRNHWRQQPAAVQVSAAARILFEDCQFAHLGQVALGLGNDASAKDRKSTRLNSSHVATAYAG